MTRRLDIEKAESLLRRLDPSMPDGFSVDGVAYSGKENAWYVRWTDPAEKEAYDRGVAGRGERQAENAYSFKPSPNWSVIWFNDAPEGGAEEPVAMVLPPEDVKTLRGSGERLVLADKA